MHQPRNGDEWEVPMEKQVNHAAGDGRAEITSMDVTADCTEVEEYIEFCPVEQPLEPLDDNRPVKCLMANSSAINGRWSISQVRVPPHTKRISQVEDMKKKMAEPVRSASHLMRKRRYSITDGDIILTPVRITPPRPSDSTTLFQMCQGIDCFKTKSASQL